MAEEMLADIACVNRHRLEEFLMRLPKTAYTSRPWRIHEFASDFSVEDVWSYRTPGAGPDDFPAMLAAMRATGGLAKQTRPVRFLFALRWKVGALLGWDKASAGVGERVASLRDRLPSDLRDAPRGPDSPSMPLKAVYELDMEAARELANKTVHTVMHLGWVQGANGDYELRMAVLVKANGWFGRLYMAAIAPFRYLLVYPALTRRWEQAWRDRAGRACRGGAGGGGPPGGGGGAGGGGGGGAGGGGAGGAGGRGGRARHAPP
ncbi:DUF2867 domain-containing protein, partial [Nonomuraea sp. NPDC050536]|uniref:DUF2867 domain-containing protein n=1 Tax=Nonomuraea sp. NPDC050536 TaxID=3364366 RepID=UPI0037CADA12